MLTKRMVDIITSIHNCISNEMTEVVEELVYRIKDDAEGIAEYLLEYNYLPDEVEKETSYQDILRWFVELCSYIENEMDIPAIISDELYDKLVEKIINLFGDHIIGTPSSNVIGIDEHPHKFPELRGSLPKAHFLWDNEVPKRDSRKSLERYIRNIIKQARAARLDISEIPVIVDIKYDGVSHIIEMKDDEVQHILTRGKVEMNLGKDLIKLFGKFYPKDGDDVDFHKMIKDMSITSLNDLVYEEGNEYGIKVETYMLSDNYNAYKKDFDINRCNRRSAVVSICNQLAEDIEVSEDVASGLNKYLTMQNFQIASVNPMEFKGATYKGQWFYAGRINNRYQYLFTQATPMMLNLNDADNVIIRIGQAITKLKEETAKSQIPFDGAVVTFCDLKMIDILGRKDDKNMFQIAFKFPAGEEKTIIEDVDFQVGPVAGRITPVARLKPIVINGNTISNVTVSNKEKLERLHLRRGDEVIIRYDIIPSIFKNSSCKPGVGDTIKFPTECPICGAEVKDEVCTNPDCPAKVVGHILNYVKKLDIRGGFGIETVELLVEKGFLNSIGDLYRLNRHKEELYNIPRFGELSVDNLISGISNVRELYPHQVLGAIGIPGVGLKTMEKICQKLNVLGNLGNLEELIIPMNNIPGIGSKISRMVVDGIERKMDLIEDVCSNISIKPYGKPKEYKASVCFTSTKNTDEFEKYLESISIKVSDTFNKTIDYLIIPDEPLEKPSTKMKNAEKWEKPMIKLSEAEEKWGYERE